MFYLFRPPAGLRRSAAGGKHAARRLRDRAGAHGARRCPCLCQPRRSVPAGRRLLPAPWRVSGTRMGAAAPCMRERARLLTGGCGRGANDLCCRFLLILLLAPSRLLRAFPLLHRELFARHARRLSVCLYKCVCVCEGVSVFVCVCVCFHALTAP